jgi:serine/threonine protein kinase
MLAKTEVAPPPSLIAEGTEIASRYRILSLIGQGGMGAVYRAQHLHLRKVFALKVLQARNIDRPDIAARFEREAIAAARIDHPNVVPATDFGRLPDGSFFLVLEFVNGRDLRSELKAGAMRVPRALGIMRGVIAGVRAAHLKEIVHRDLKPENIMLVERDGNRDFVKLLDFGVARVDIERDGGPQLTEVGTMLGTPQYMSPEQILGRATDVRSDLYSLGVVFFELLTGRCPFAGNLATLLEQHVTLPPPELPSALATQEPRLAEILRTLLAKDPEKRFQTAKELADALEQASPQSSRASIVRAVSPASRPNAFMQRMGGVLSRLGHHAPSSLGKFASSTSAAASSGMGRVREYLDRLERGRRRRALARNADRQVTRAVVAVRQAGHQSAKTWRKLAAGAKERWGKGLEYCRTQWQLHPSRWKLAVASIAGLIVIALVVLMARISQGVSRPEDSARSERANGARSQPAKPGGSKSRR